MVRILLTIIVFPTFFSCTNKLDENQNIFTSLLSFRDKASPIQSFKIEPNRDTIIVGNQGTKVFISSNSFVFENGEPVSTGIKLRLKEIYSFSDMILNRISTTSNEELLETSGMINLTAFSNNRPLILIPTRPIKIRFKKISNSDFMQTYLGDFDSLGLEWRLDSLNIYDTLKFKESLETIFILDDGSESPGIMEFMYGIIGSDTIELEKSRRFPDRDFALAEEEYLPFFEIHSTQLNWINCDFFNGSEDKINVMIESPPSSTTVDFLVFKEFNSIMRSSFYNKELTIFKNIPRGSEVAIVSIRKIDEDYFLSLIDRTLLENNERIQLEYKNYSLEEVGNRLKVLDKMQENLTPLSP